MKKQLLLAAIAIASLSIPKTAQADNFGFFYKGGPVVFAYNTYKPVHKHHKHHKKVKHAHDHKKWHKKHHKKVKHYQKPVYYGVKTYYPPVYYSKQSYGYAAPYYPNCK